MGLERGPSSGRGASSGVAASCWRRSGEALSSTQRLPSRLTASEDCVRALRPGLPARTSAQLRQLQLTCGNPPPAAEPRTLMIMAPARKTPSFALRAPSPQGEKGRRRRLCSPLAPRSPLPIGERTRGHDLRLRNCSRARGSTLDGAVVSHLAELVRGNLPDPNLAQNARD